MDIINKEFTKLIENHFLTENVSLVLYSLIKTIRPLKILEVGTGYSTLIILKSIKDIQEENLIFEKSLKTNNFSNYTGKNYVPNFTVIDNFSLINEEKYKEVIEVFEREDLIKNLTLAKADIFYFLLKTKDNYDFIWIDAGLQKEYSRLFKILDKKLNKNGTIIIHSTLTNKEGKRFLDKFNNKNYEKISFLEPHKKFQNSFTIFNKKGKIPVFTESA